MVSVCVCNVHDVNCKWQLVRRLLRLCHTFSDVNEHNYVRNSILHIIIVAGEFVFSGWISIMLHHRNNTLRVRHIDNVTENSISVFDVNALPFRPNYSLFSLRSFISLCLASSIHMPLAMTSPWTLLRSDIVDRTHARSTIFNAISGRDGHVRRFWVANCICSTTKSSSSVSLAAVHRHQFRCDNAILLQRRSFCFLHASNFHTCVFMLAGGDHATCSTQMADSVNKWTVTCYQEMASADVV